MATATIGTATIVLSAQHEKLTAGFQSAGKQVNSFGAGITDIAKKMAATIGPAAALGMALKTAFGEANRLDDIADATGLAVAEVVQFEGAAIRAGVGIEGLSTAIAKMNVTVGQALGGNKAAVENLESMGVSLDAIKNKSPAERFRLIASAIGSIEDRSKQAAAAAEVFGKASGKLVDLLGSDELQNPPDAFDADKINRSSAALNKITDHMSGFFQSIKTGTMTSVGNAADFWLQKLGLIRTAYKGIEQAASDAGSAIQEKTKEQIAKEQKDRQDYVNWLGKKEDDKNKAQAKAYQDAMAMLVANTESVQQIEAGSNAELMALEKEYQTEFARLQKSGMDAGITDTKNFREAELALHKNYALKRKALEDKMADDARKRGLELEQMAKGAADAQATHATQSLRGAMDALGVWESKMKKAGDEVRKNREQTKQMLGGDSLVLRPQAQIKADEEAARKAEEAHRAKIETGRAYAESLGNIIDMTDKLGEKSREAFMIDKAAKMASAIVNAWVGYTAALTIPPPAGQILAGTTLAAGFFAASQIAAQQPPGRANGGAISKGSAYEVGERGPEILQMGGRNFILPGRDGFVNAGGPGGGSGGTTVNVTVNNKPGQTAVVTQSGPASSPNISIDIIDQMVAAAVSNGRSSTSRAMQSRFGLNGARGAQ